MNYYITVGLLLIPLLVAGQLKEVERSIKNVKSSVLKEKQYVTKYQQKSTKYVEALQKQLTLADGAKDSIKSYFGIIYGIMHQEQENLIENLPYIGEAPEKLSDYHLNDFFEIYGWHPYWLNGTQENYNFNLLSTLSYFSYDINPDNGFPQDAFPIDDWKTTSTVDSMQAREQRVELTVTCFGSLNTFTFLNDENNILQDNFLDSLVSLLSIRNASGVCINFEGMPRNVGDLYSAFIEKLHLTLRNTGEAYDITITLPPFDYVNAYDFKKLSKYVSRYVIMGYDYYGATSGPGPIAPIPLKENKQTRKILNIPFSIKTYKKKGVPYNDMILALPYYGGVWFSENEDMSEAFFVRHLSYSQIRDKITNDKLTPKFDTLSSSFYLEYRDSLGYYQCWYDDEYTLDIKYDWATKKGLKGVGIWVLGYDNGYSALWQNIADNYSTEALSKPFSDRRVVSIGLFLSKHQKIFIVGAVLAFLFIVIGFIRALFDWRIREALFLHNAVRIFYILLIIAFCSFLIIVFELFNSRFWIFIVGIIVGFIASYFSKRLTFSYRLNRP